MADTATLIDRALDATLDAGLAVDAESLDCSGNLAHCVTQEKPNRQYGSYKLFLDDWPRIWLCN